MRPGPGGPFVRDFTQETPRCRLCARLQCCFPCLPSWPWLCPWALPAMGAPSPPQTMVALTLLPSRWPLRLPALPAAAQSPCALPTPSPPSSPTLRLRARRACPAAGSSLRRVPSPRAKIAPVARLAQGRPAQPHPSSRACAQLPQTLLATSATPLHPCATPLMGRGTFGWTSSPSPRALRMAGTLCCTTTAPAPWRGPGERTVRMP